MVCQAMLHKQICTKTSFLTAPDCMDMVAAALNQVVFEKEIGTIESLLLCTIIEYLPPGQ
jgi:hypothetical protein